MSTCIKDFYDYDLVKNCSTCANISQKSFFHKNKNRKDGVYSMCKFCLKNYSRKTMINLF